MNNVMMNMPCTVRAFVKVTAEPDGDYETVVLNSRLTHEANVISYVHEQDHITNADFDRECADDVERERHG